MSEIGHRTLRVNGLDMHVAEAGTGPLVVLLHGFPELWYSWRHQLPVLAGAGFHAVAPDLRGHGQTSAPTGVAGYGMAEHVADVVGLLDALGAETAVLVGHDWGARTVWAAGELHPQRFPGLAVLSVPHSARSARPPVEQLREWAGDRFNWMLYFQEPGVAEAELADDVTRTLRLMMYGLSGDAGELGIRLVAGLPRDALLLNEIPEPPGPLSWLTAADLSYYSAQYRQTGFTGALNRYRNADRDWHRLPTLGTTALRQPALFVAGALDSAVRFGDPTTMRERVPGLTELILLPGCGHWVQQERPHEVNDALLAFLRSI
ncbi:MAG: alpha/beta hydrolase [Nocardia sp.]|uniref:alpha/beta fold hydrolase n=1 Tax=Nocardia sp. TaxID=1821 RepID=UPI0026364B89|nr:alpha/beta hydrolase [Nocardia sp.]MCU1647339.1 alpha/beta hydrolase [Nocardia sp.]